MVQQATPDMEEIFIPIMVSIPAIAPSETKDMSKIHTTKKQRLTVARAAPVRIGSCQERSWLIRSIFIYLRRHHKKYNMKRRIKMAFNK